MHKAFAILTLGVSFIISMLVCFVLNTNEPTKVETKRVEINVECLADGTIQVNSDIIITDELKKVITETSKVICNETAL